MSKTAIIKSGEHFFIKQLSRNEAIKLDEFIFANIDGVNANTEIDLNSNMPSENQIVYKAKVTQSGLLNDNTVVYSIVLDTNIGDFSFNYIGLINSETQTLCMVMHTDLTRKIKTAGQHQGNTITESVWLEIDNAAEATGVTVNAETWQIDYSKRLAGEDERIRLTNYDLYNRLYIKNGMQIRKNGNQLTISSGVAYIAGLRIDNTIEKLINIEKNQSLFIDAWLDGTITGEWTINYNFIVGENLKDYQKLGIKHYVERIASIDATGNLTTIDSPSFIRNCDLATFDVPGIVKLNSAIDSNSETDAATPKAVKKAYDKAINAFPNTGGIVNGLIKSNQPKTYDIVASNNWIRAVANTFPNAILAHEAGGGGFAIVTGADDATLGKTANLTFASWNGVGFAPMHASGQKDTAINSTVVVNCRLGTVYALNGFYEQGKKLIKQDEYGVGHQNLSLTKISDNLNEQNASFFGSTYVNMPESIKPYINNGAGIVGINLPYRVTSEGWKASSRFFTVIGGIPSTIFYQECHNGTWQKPIKLITEENANDILPVGIPQPWPTTTPPTGWLKCDGSAFNKNKYPLLAKAYQSGFLPDLRGEFIRGLDSGANIDLNRNILSKQGDQARNATGFWFGKNRGGADGKLITITEGGKTGGDAGGQGAKHTIDFSKVWPTGDEFRPRNIAFLYIVKAA